jgi:carboxylesterase
VNAKKIAREKIMMMNRGIEKKRQFGWLLLVALWLVLIGPLTVSSSHAASASPSPEKIVCLLIHGFAGSPVEMEPLALALEAEGFEVVRLTLPGHATSIDDFSHTFFPDWLAAAERACQQELARGRRVVVIGHSMGGSLALHLAEHYDLAGVVTLAAPVYLYRFFPPEAADWRLPLVGLLKYIRPRWPKAPEDPVAREIAPWGGYSGVRLLPQLHSFIRGLEPIEEELGKITEPLLILHALRDEVVPTSNALTIANGVRSAEVTVELFTLPETPAGRHIIPSHRDCRALVAARVSAFLHRLEKEQGAVKL